MMIEQLSGLAAVCDEDERDIIEKMVSSAAAYINAVTDMKSKSYNFAGRTGEDLRTALERSDRERTNAHNALIAYVNIVNRICTAHNRNPIYVGPTDLRRAYGDFAIQLVGEIFANR